MFSKWGHILRLYVLLKQLHWIISHEEMNKGSLIKYMQNLAKSLWQQTLSWVKQFCHFGLDKMWLWSNGTFLLVHI